MRTYPTFIPYPAIKAKKKGGGAVRGRFSEDEHPRDEKSVKGTPAYRKAERENLVTLQKADRETLKAKQTRETSKLAAKQRKEKKSAGSTAEKTAITKRHKEEKTALKDKQKDARDKLSTKHQKEKAALQDAHKADSAEAKQNKKKPEAKPKKKPKTADSPEATSTGQNRNEDVDRAYNDENVDASPEAKALTHNLDRLELLITEVKALYALRSTDDDDDPYHQPDPAATD